MLALHTTVLLYKQFDDEGFGILSEEFHTLEENLSFVHLTDVQFAICEPKKQIMEETGKRIIHAYAVGTLNKALPKSIVPKADILKQWMTMPEVYYNPYTTDHFCMKGTGTKIEAAKELFAFLGRIKVIL